MPCCLAQSIAIALPVQELVIGPVVHIRKTLEQDLPGLRSVLSHVDLFPPEMLDEMIAGFLGNPATQDLWLSCLIEHDVVGFCFVVPEELTDGTVNMLALAVLPEFRKTGCGRALVAHAEDALAARGARLMIVETSGTAAFAPARAFYATAGYDEESRIRDYWAVGDDKITFRKLLG